MVCTETQRFCGLCRGSRGLENWKRFLIAHIGGGERAGESGRGCGQQQHEGASEPFQGITGGEFPGGPVVKTLCFHRRDHRFNPPAWGTKIFHAAWHTTPTPKASLKGTGRIFYFAALVLHCGLRAL